MANDLLNTKTTSFGELVSNGKQYEVPPFQRDYAWNVENWDDLWQDIITVYRTKTPHFMGTIVTQRPQSSTVESGFSPNARRTVIIDGQQRLVTLSILTISIIQKVQALVDKGIEPEANLNRQEILRRSYLGDKNAISLRYSSKLSLNENDEGFYQNNLVNFRPPKNIYALTKSERSLWQAFEYFSQQLEKHSEISEAGDLLADLLTDSIAQRLVFIQIDVEDTTNAYVLFETLNSRGVELGATDLLKNYIFSLLKGPDDHNAARYEWQKIVRTVRMTEFPAFLKSFLSMTEPHVRKSRLFKLTREKVKTAEQAFSLLEQLSSYSDLYVALGNANDDFWRGYSNSKSIRALVQQLDLFAAKQTYSVLLAASTKFDEGKFEKLLKVMTTIVFRYVVVSELSANELENQCNALAIAISKGKVKSPKAAFDYVSSTLYVQDEKFQQDFAFLSIDNQQQKGLLKYILKQLEKETSGKDVPAESFSVEHILPQNPDNLWRQSFGHSQVEDYIYRLGNMTPLEPRENSALGRAGYAVKQSAYTQSAYAMTQNIQAEEWTADAIASRQEKMAEQAVKVWRVDY